MAPVGLTRGRVEESGPSAPQSSATAGAVIMLTSSQPRPLVRGVAHSTISAVTPLATTTANHTSNSLGALPREVQHKRCW